MIQQMLMHRKTCLIPILILVATIMCGIFYRGSLFCGVVLSVLSSFEIIFLRKRELDALLILHCALVAVWLSMFCILRIPRRGLICGM